MDEKIKKVKKLSDFAVKLGLTPAALSIAWCLKNPHVSTVILGATKKQQLLDNLSSLEVLPKLTPDIMEKIETIMKTKPVLPEF